MYGKNYTKKTFSLNQIDGWIKFLDNKLKGCDDRKEVIKIQEELITLHNLKIEVGSRWQ